jgi:hypothetical protein
MVREGGSTMKRDRATDRNRIKRVFAYAPQAIGCLLLALGIFSCGDLGTPVEIPSKWAANGDAVIVIEVGNIPGFPTSLRIEDSLGRATSSARVGEPLWLRYTALNQTGKSQTWFTGMGYPHARFLIKQGADTLVDSFSGMAFLAVPLNGVVVNGDSLTAGWRLDPAQHVLNPGTYTAMALPTYVVGMAHMPKNEVAVFSVIP